MLKNLFFSFLDLIRDFAKAIVSFFLANNVNEECSEDVLVKKIDTSESIDKSLYEKSTFSNIVTDDNQKDLFFKDLALFIKNNSLSSDIVYYTFCPNPSEVVPPTLKSFISDFTYIQKIIDFSQKYDFMMSIIFSGCPDILFSDYLRKMIFSNDPDVNYNEYSSYFSKILYT